MKSFIVSVNDNATKESRDTLTAELTGIDQVEVWHHITLTWIIRDRRPKPFTPVVLRNRIMELMPNVRFQVFELENNATFAGFGPIDGNRWLESHFPAKTSSS
jgi:hypothetical protein